MTKVVRLLLAGRGNPDRGQDPSQPPHGAEGDKLVAVTGGDWDTPEGINETLDRARCFVRAFCEGNDLGGGNWVGGDLWVEGEHQGHFSFNGRFQQGEQGPLVRSGQFVFPAWAPAQQVRSLPDRPGEWTDVLLSAVEASTDDHWQEVFSLRPDLADRLRSVLARMAPDDEAEPAAGPRM